MLRFFLGMLLVVGILIGSHAPLQEAIADHNGTAHPFWEVGTVYGQPGDTVDIPVTLNLNGDLARSMFLRLDYNPAGLQYVICWEGQGHPGGKWSFACNSPQGGDVRYFSTDWSVDGYPFLWLTVYKLWVVVPEDGVCGQEFPVYISEEDVLDLDNQPYELDWIHGKVVVGDPNGGGC